ncbi:hypothetical protein JCM3774_005894 [Rhodotorula dairenensis]
MGIRAAKHKVAVKKEETPAQVPNGLASPANCDLCPCRECQSAAKSSTIHRKIIATLLQHYKTLTPEQQLSSCSDFERQLELNLRRALLNLNKVEIAHTLELKKQQALLDQSIQEALAKRQELKDRLLKHQLAWKQGRARLAKRHADRL